MKEKKSKNCDVGIRELNRKEICNGGSASVCDPTKINFTLTPFTLVITISLLVSGCEQYRLDAQVRELCAKDGGIHVYETVKLPADKFNRWGQINFYYPTRRENALGPEYLFKEDIHYYLKGEYEALSMRRVHVQIFRRSDAKLLGELIGYSRRGGDLLSPPFHPSSFRCPEGYGDTVLLKQIFTKTNSKEENNE